MIVWAPHQACLARQPDYTLKTCGPENINLMLWRSFNLSVTYWIKEGGGGAALFSLDVQIKTSSLKSSHLRAGPPNNGYLHSFQLFRKSSLSASERKIIIRRKQSSFGAHTQMQHAVVLNHRTLLITEGGNTKRWKQTLCHRSGCNEAICQQTNNHFKSTDINCFATAVLLRKLFYFFWWPSLFLLVSPQLSGYSLQSLVRLSECTRHD